MPFIAPFLSRNKALGYPRFRNYMMMRFSIIMALNMQAAIIAYYVYQLTHDKLALGMIGLWEVIPAVGVSMFSGHFVDLREKRTLLVRCFFAYLLLSAFFVSLTWPGIDGLISTRGIVWLIYAGIFAGGALRAFISPSSFALMGMLVPKDLYPNATTWSSAAWQAGAVLGPLAGGFMIAYAGFRTSLVCSGLIEVVGLLALLRIPKQQILNKTREPIFKSLGEGIRFVFSTQIILAALSLDMFAVLFGGAVALLPVFTDDILKAGEVGYGWLRAAPGIGSIITLLILSFVPLGKKPGVKLLICIAGFGITTILFGLCGHFGTEPVFSYSGFAVSYGFLVAFLMLLAGGMFDAVSVVIRGTILQVYTPDNMRGRVAAVNTMFISSSNELGAMESGITARLMGTVPAVVFGGCMTLLVVAVTWFKAPALHTLSLHGGEDKDTDKKTN
ncbi:nickel resistance MFS transporter NreB [Nemorincola caseinilytica]|uniref:Nickel resistance MFS transporter NreB n=1 Tax=Nemorincola caseinilytica TaxID=2054315 RepID=A0ABP8NJ80_9BACT